LASDFSCLYFGLAMQLVIIVACLRANGGAKLLPNNRTGSANIYAALGLAWHGVFGKAECQKDTDTRIHTQHMLWGLVPKRTTMVLFVCVQSTVIKFFELLQLSPSPFYFVRWLGKLQRFTQAT